MPRKHTDAHMHVYIRVCIHDALTARRARMARLGAPSRAPPEPFTQARHRHAAAP